MNFLQNRQAEGLQTDFDWARNTLRSNVPELPVDFDRWPGKYALDCDAAELGAWVPNSAYDGAPELEAARAGASVEIDQTAEAARLRYITPGVGQALTYQRKYEQAWRYKEAGYPSGSLADYPLVKAEKEATGETGRVAADGILAKAAEWEALAAVIEKERRAAKLAVAAATDIAAIEAARDPALEALGAV